MRFCFSLQGKLGLDRGVSLENLTVGHFISVLDRLADPALLQFVKHLQSRAQGEVGLDPHHLVRPLFPLRNFTQSPLRRVPIEGVSVDDIKRRNNVVSMYRIGYDYIFASSPLDALVRTISF